MSVDRSNDGGTKPGFRTITDLRYDERTDRYRARYDAATAHELFVDIVLAVSNVLDVGTDDIEPAHRAVDTDVLDAVVDAYGRDAGLSFGPVVFSLDDCVVTVAEEELTFERRTS